MSLMDKLSGGLITTVVGLSVVFFALLCLILVIVLMGKALGRFVQKETVAATPAPVQKQPVQAQAVAPVATNDGAISCQTLAAISAAIATATGTTANGFRIVEIKKV